jgi:hypothetical protein
MILGERGSGHVQPVSRGRGCQGCVQEQLQFWRQNPQHLNNVSIPYSFYIAIPMIKFCPDFRRHQLG